MTSKANFLLQLSLLLLVIQQKVFTNGLYEADYYELYYDLPNEDIKNKLLDDFKSDLVSAPKSTITRPKTREDEPLMSENKDQAETTTVSTTTPASDTSSTAYADSLIKFAFAYSSKCSIAAALYAFAASIASSKISQMILLSINHNLRFPFSDCIRQTYPLAI